VLYFPHDDGSSEGIRVEPMLVKRIVLRKLILK
jgi:hypothetical protein